MPAIHNEISFVLEDQIEMVERLQFLTRKLVGALDRIGVLEATVEHHEESLHIVTGNLVRALERLEHDEESLRIVTSNLSRALDRIGALEAKR